MFQSPIKQAFYTASSMPSISSSASVVRQQQPSKHVPEASKSRSSLQKQSDLHWRESNAAALTSQSKKATASTTIKQHPASSTPQSPSYRRRAIVSDDEYEDKDKSAHRTAKSQSGQKRIKNSASFLQVCFHCSSFVKFLALLIHSFRKHHTREAMTFNLSV